MRALSLPLRTIALAACLTCVLASAAYDFEVDGIYYSKNGANATVVSGDSLYLGEVTIPSTVTNEGTTYTVTAIGNNAFKECVNLYRVDIPASVTNIGAQAFRGCTGLTEVILPDGITVINDYTFQSCSNLSSINIPTGVTSIGNYAFNDCSSLLTLDIPAGVTTIGSHAFNGCASLNGITIPEGITTVNEGTFKNCSSLTAINIPAGVTSIYSNASYHTPAFVGCTGLKTLTWNARSCSSRGAMPTGNIERATIGDEVTLLPASFLSGSKVTDIVIPDGVTSIGSSAFRDCASLSEIILPDSVTQISGHLFYGCTSLENIVIPSAVTTIGTYAFYGCSALKNLICRSTTPPTIESSTAINSIRNSTNLRVPRAVIEDYQAADLWKYFMTIVPDEYDFMVNGIYYIQTGDATASVTYKDADFNSYSGAINIPSKVTHNDVTYSVTGIGLEAFKNCTDMAQVSMGKKLTSVGYSAFEGCTKLDRIRIPRRCNDHRPESF